MTSCDVTHPQCQVITPTTTTAITNNSNPPTIAPTITPTLLSSDEPLFGTGDGECLTVVDDGGMNTVVVVVVVVISAKVMIHLSKSTSIRPLKINIIVTMRKASLVKKCFSQ